VACWRALHTLTSSNTNIIILLSLLSMVGGCTFVTAPLTTCTQRASLGTLQLLETTIFNWGGAVTIHTSCASGSDGIANQLSALDVDGSVSGPSKPPPPP